MRFHLVLCHDLSILEFDTSLKYVKTLNLPTTGLFVVHLMEVKSDEFVSNKSSPKEYHLNIQKVC